MSASSSAKRGLQRLWESSEAHYRSQILSLLPQDGEQRLLDVGCDDGAWTSRLVATMGIPAEHVSGIEVVASARAQAQARGYDVREGELEERWPFEARSFDVVHANQVIEHVKRLDHFAEETHRVLSPGGRAVICTENLSAWHNVAAAALGYMPFSYTNVSQKGPVGNPFALHAGEEMARGESWQHIHVVTLDGLAHLFELHGFVIERKIGAGYYPAFGRPGRWLAERDPRHAHFIGIVARAA